MTPMNHDFNFYPKSEHLINHELGEGIINDRALARHDSHHITTGFARNGADEAGLISVSVQQDARPGFDLLHLAGPRRSWPTSPQSHRDVVNSPDPSGMSIDKVERIGKRMDIDSKATSISPIEWSSSLDQKPEDARANLAIDTVVEGICGRSSGPAIRSTTGR